ncbi:uncharacterized protein LOC129883520 [Solanum dulcamara]|uniref:uncharacterized protein LOC129883520 n=1 Tax=Solanum dulcamara TaxID=45834 RepID=UPI00248588F6|nr:uncharacterized protein LOC129883520 [Solanum dulcamara]
MDSLDIDLLRDAMEQVRRIQGIFLKARSRQKSYADHRLRPLEFMLGDHVWLRVSPMKAVMYFEKMGKLSPQFIGPFEILAHVGEYVPDESYVLLLDLVELGPDLTFEEEPIAILERQVRKLRTKEIDSVKVQWKHHSVGEATWKTEADMRARYPQLFEASELSTDALHKFTHREGEGNTGSKGWVLQENL